MAGSSVALAALIEWKRDEDGNPQFVSSHLLTHFLPSDSTYNESDLARAWTEAGPDAAEKQRRRDVYFDGLVTITPMIEKAVTPPPVKKGRAGPDSNLVLAKVLDEIRKKLP